MTESRDIDAKLLNELRISQELREDRGARVPRWAWWTAGLGVVALLLAALSWWWLHARPLAVQTALAQSPAAARAAGAVLQATGYVTARRQATVSTQITGTLTQVLIEEGDRVKAGQVIARLEDSALRAALASAQAQAQAAQAVVQQTRSQLEQAQADAERQAELAASGMVTKQVAEQSRTAVHTLGAQLDAARKQADAARSQLAQAKVNFDFTVVRAPFAGVVTEKAAQVGEIVSPLSAGGGFTRTGVGTIVDMDSLEVDVDVNEAYIGQVAPGMPVEAVLGAYADWKIPAHVIAIVPTADRGKATVKVRIALEQKDPRIVPNMGARVSFLSPARTGAASAPLPQGVLVPAQAVAQRDGRSVVFVVVDGRAALRAVTPRDAQGGMKLLPQAVTAGERVVLSPPETLRDGAAVENSTR